MKYVPVFKDGQRVTFSMEDISLSEFELNDDFNLFDYEDKECTIVCLETVNAGDDDEPDKDFEYYDIRFDDGVVLHGISGYHLEKIS